MFFQPSHNLTGTRRVAFALALVCLWMSGGATLHHTDDFDSLKSFHASGRIVLTHATQQPPAEQCVAHEWLTAWHTLHATTPAILVPLPETLSVAKRPGVVLHLLCFDYKALRAPPTIA